MRRPRVAPTEQNERMSSFSLRKERDRSQLMSSMHSFELVVKSVGVGNPRLFAYEFATSVTCSSSKDHHWVARNGADSLFALFQQIFPEVYAIIKKMFLSYDNGHCKLHSSFAHIDDRSHQVIQPNHRRCRLRGKITAAEFNKALEAHEGFVCTRTRQTRLTR